MPRLIPLTLVLALAACPLAHAMDMNAENNVSELEAPVMKGGKMFKEKLPIVPITADLISAREHARRQAVNNLPRVDTGPADYRICARDGVRGHAGLNEPTDNGELYYPYAGAIPAGGKTAGAARALLTRELPRYFKPVKLDVRVSSFQRYRAAIVGSVKTPGVQAVTETPPTLAEAVSRAGGAAPEADMGNVTLARDGKLYKIDVSALCEKGGGARNLLLKDGDVLNIPDRNDNKVLVMGETGRRQPLEINKSKLSLAQALAEAHGLEFNSFRSEEVYVIRPGDMNPEIFQLNMESPYALILAGQFALQPHDTVFVGAAGVAQWARMLKQIRPSSFASIMSRAAFVGM